MQQYTAEAIEQNAPPIAADIPTNIVNLVLRPFSSMTETVDDIIDNSDDLLEFFASNWQQILKEHFII